MKILYSQIQELLPDLKATAQEAGETLTMTGFMMDELEEVKYKGGKDYVISLEVRQNRADCLSVIGVARELAASYNIDIKLPEAKVSGFGSDEIDIDIKSKDVVKRISAVEISGLENKESPDWLKEWLAFYDINSINFLVDLSNYVMMYTGYTSHLLDKDKMSEGLTWKINDQFDKIITLDGTEIELSKNNELVICDSKNVLALAGMVGGQAAAIDINTKNIVCEMAVYDRTIVRQNSRSLKVVTEASTRLEKELDPNGLDYAINLLISLILENCGGNLNTKLFEYYPDKKVSSKIEMDISAPTVYAGVEISDKRVVEVLESLRFEVEKNGSKLVVTPPTDRMDVNLMEDVVEEVVRIVGFDNIPSDITPDLTVVKDITSKNIYLADKARDILVNLGLDEILSLPLVRVGDNEKLNHLDWETITTQNSINDEYPFLRQSIASGLLIQLEEYIKKNVEYVDIFEIGRVFGKKGNEYTEHDSLGVLMRGNKTINDVKSNLETLLRSLGSNDIYYSVSKIKPEIANPSSCWDILVDDKSIGIVYKLKPQNDNVNTYFFEINLFELLGLLEKTKHNPVVEITKKLVILDANVELSEKESITDYVKDLKKKIDEDKLWSIVIHDIFPLDNNKVRYTIRTTYQELLDQEAKKLHADVFGL